MPFDPSLPAPNSPLESQVIRDQLQALFVLINDIVTATSAQVDGTTTLPPGSGATASVFLSGNTLHFSFALPQGENGAAGAPGSIINGAQVDGVATLNPSDPATASASYDGSVIRFTFGIPRGLDGAPPPPPEVTLPMLDAAIAGSSANTNAVATLDNPFADPDMEALRQKLNEMLLAARR
jgi:hypothetical protein